MKKIISLLLACLLTFSLVSCGGETEPVDQSNTPHVPTMGELDMSSVDASYFVQSEEHQSFIVTLVVDLINVNLHLSFIVPFFVFMLVHIQLQT